MTWTQSLAICATFALFACGETAPLAGDAGPSSQPDGQSTAPDASLALDGSADRDAGAPTTPIGDGGGRRCENPFVGPAPGGGACDWSRIIVTPAQPTACALPGAHCDELQFEFTWTGSSPPPTIPPSFSCWNELGVTGCSLIKDGGTITLDNASLAAACQVTQLVPEVPIRCVVYL